MQKSFSLLELTQSIQNCLQKNYGSNRWWIRCEIAKMNVHSQNGHCYLELIEKDERAVLAQVRGIMWSDIYNELCKKFSTVTKQKLSDGMSVMLQCTVNFHPVYGFSLTINDIEPSFTLGEMARMKNEVIRRLQHERLFEQNREKEISLLPGRIAVISVDSSRGYHDFISTLNHSAKKFAIYPELFPAILQGENAVPTLLKALSVIEKKKKDFDTVAIIRGGAGDAGLTCYDEYLLASAIAKFPLPVVTGIGHATNETVTEMVAYKNCITPTAAANFFLNCFVEQDHILTKNISFLKNEISSMIVSIHYEFTSHVNQFRLLSANGINIIKERLLFLSKRIPSQIRYFFRNENEDLKNKTLFLISGSKQILHVNKNFVSGEIKKLYSANVFLSISKNKIENSEEKVKLLDPVNVLKRGYSITRHQNEIIFSKNISKGEFIETEFADGKLISEVK